MPKTFGLMDFPLTGRRLIEASAGTGKTYNISHLYLRLLLGVGEGTSPASARTVEEILVVTFTRAAADELRGRIRGLLERARTDLEAGTSRNALVQQLIDATQDDEEARLAMQRRLRTALLSMDEAAISTIHAFAVKAASAFLFEIGAIDDVVLTHDGGGRDERALTDLYRRLVNEPALGPIFDLLERPKYDDFLAYWKTTVPERAQVHPGIGGDADTALASIAADYQALANTHELLAGEWRSMFWTSSGGLDVAAAKSQLLEALGDETNSALGAGDVGHLVKHIDAALTGPGLGIDDKRGSGYGKKWLATDIPPNASPALDLLRRVRAHIVAVLEDGAALAGRARAAVLLAVRQARARLDLREMSLDDVITLINRRLDEPDTRQALCDAITARHPVCLVDEFQDTDPEQFRMFDRLYAHAPPGPGAGLFMIGDPKQSIYAFRGADLFAYLNVRARVTAAREHGDESQDIYSLDTNWRSRPELVAGVNALFAEPEPATGPGAGVAPTFVFDGMTYQPVKDCTAHAPDRIPRFRVGDKCPVTGVSLHFIGHPGGSAEAGDLSGSKLIALFARDAAARISALLCPVNGAKMGEGEAARPLRPMDIAVLVRNQREARAIREALAADAIGLRSVYASQRDSVFADSEIAEDLLLVLRAIDACRDRRKLKSALATPLMRGFDPGFEAVTRVDEDDDELERTIAEFGACRQAWLANGVLSALDQLMGSPRRRLLAKIAERPDSDRLLTDLRHLGDLLQQRDQACDSPEQLIDWYTACLEDNDDLDEDDRRIRLESDEDLVRIVTVYSAKGLEYPVVFLPFFYLPKLPDLKKSLPVYREWHGEGWRAVVDFKAAGEDVKQRMQRERLAEDMRLLYVAVTRAVHQCHIGISAASYRKSTALFPQTPWGHLLTSEPGESEMPAFPDRAWLFDALRRRLGQAARDTGFSVAGEVEPVYFRPDAAAEPDLVRPPRVSGPVSNWRVTSYTGLVRGEAPRLDARLDDDEDTPAETEDGVEDEAAWADDIRFALPGSAHTGSCLHDILETYALACAQGQGGIVKLQESTAQQLAQYGLDDVLSATDDGASVAARVSDWMAACLEHPLPGDTRLGTLFDSGRAIPEMRFDFAIGGQREAAFDAINHALREAGLLPLERYGAISGLMTGAIDLVYEHDRSFYVVDYKSNTLGRTPGRYDQDGMGACIRDHRYDLQYMIYAVAAQRYFRTRLGDRYGYDDGEYRFGGVCYLFLRGMGLPGMADHGTWFHRPGAGQVDALDRALAGGTR